MIACAAAACRVVTVRSAARQPVDEHRHRGSAAACSSDCSVRSASALGVGDESGSAVGLVDAVEDAVGVGVSVGLGDAVGVGEA